MDGRNTLLLPVTARGSGCGRLVMDQPALHYEANPEVRINLRVPPCAICESGGLGFPIVRNLINLRPEAYDGTTDWLEYLVYFKQLSEV